MSEEKPNTPIQKLTLELVGQNAKCASALETTLGQVLDAFTIGAVLGVLDASAALPGSSLSYRRDPKTAIATLEIRGPVDRVLVEGVCLADCAAKIGTSEAKPLFDPFVVWAHDRDAWWRPGAKGYTPNLVEAGVFTSTDGLNLTGLDEVRKLSEYTASKGSVGELLASGVLKGASS